MESRGIFAADQNSAPLTRRQTPGSAIVVKLNRFSCGFRGDPHSGQARLEHLRPPRVPPISPIAGRRRHQNN
jgi:hypothetical protein